MRTFLIVLIGLVGGYLICIGVYNEWAFLADIEPKEVAKRIFTATYMACICSFFAWVVFTGLFEWWD